MNHLYLVRHGENLANLTKEFSYRKVDYSLTPKGLLQAQQTAEFFRDKNIHEIYTSPLKRAAETAQCIADVVGLAVTPVEEFREINVGDLEGQSPTDELWVLHNSIIDGWWDGKPDMRFPGGENYFQLVERARQGYTSILQGKTGRNIVVVAHGGIISLPIRSICAGIDLQSISQPIPNCGITELEAQVADGQLRVELLTFAACSHLSGEAAKFVSGLPAKGSLKQGKES